MRVWLAWLVLFAIWLLLAGVASVADVLVGMAAAALALAWVRYPREGGHRFHPVRLLYFLPWYGWLLVREAAIVAVESLRREPRRGAMVTSIATDLSPWELSLAAMFVTFVPGTTVVEADERTRTLYVHGIGHSREKVERQTRRLVHRVGGWVR